MRILIVEDSRRLRQTVATAMRRSGYRVDECGDGIEALWKARETPYDAMILDIMLPGMDGLEILEKLRSDGVDSPVLMLTARDSIEDRVNGLRHGADDYLCKPFALEELLARVDVLCRRRHGKRSPLLSVADLTVDTSAKKATRNGRELGLTSREYALLELMTLNAGRVLSREEIERHIYDEHVSPMSNVVDSTVYALRKKMELGAGMRPMIHTRRGQGYVLEDPAR